MARGTCLDCGRYGNHMDVMEVDVVYEDYTTDTDSMTTCDDGFGCNTEDD